MCVCDSRANLSLDRFLVRFLLSFMIALLVFGSAIAMYANAASFASIPSALGEVNVTVSTSSTKTSSVIARVQPVATDYNINIPKEVFTVDTFLKTSSALISGGTETGNSVANLAKALGSLPWVLPLLAAIIAIPFVVRAWRGFARVAIVLAIVSSLAIVLLVVPYTLMGFITTGECSNNVRQGLMNYVSASTSDKCAADVIQFYLLCVRLLYDPRPSTEPSNDRLVLVLGSSQSKRRSVRPCLVSEIPNQQSYR